MHAKYASTKSSKAQMANDIWRMPLTETRSQALIEVTPDVAKKWLEYNTANRCITKDTLNRYTDDMKAGRWADNGESIKFSKGKLLDGQHRLLAIIQSDKTLVLSVEFGLVPESQDFMDIGRHRTPRDVLSIEGLGAWESRTLGSAIHTMIEVDRGGMIYGATKHSNADARAYYLENFAAIEKSLRTIHSVYGRNKSLIPAALAVALHYLFSRKSEEAADIFFDKLFSGEDLSRDSSIWRLRNRLVSDAIQRTRRSQYERIGFVIKAWNSYRAGRPMKSDTSLYMRAGDAYPEVK